MSEHNYNYRDSDLSLYLMNSDYILLLQIYASSFSYAIVYQNKLMAWAEDCDLALLDEPGYDHQVLTYDYKHIVAGLQPTGFTLVPALLFSEDKIADFARLLDVKATEKVLVEPLDDDNYIVYKVDEKTAATAQIYGLHKAAFINKGWINAIANAHPQHNHLYLNIDKNQVSILYFANGKVRFYNTFEFNNPDELAYYATYVAQELQLQPHTLIVTVSGDVNVDDKNATRLADFFNGVEQSDLSVVKLPSTLFKHQLLALSALTLCVSSEVY